MITDSVATPFQRLTLPPIGDIMSSKASPSTSTSTSTSSPATSAPSMTKSPSPVVESNYSQYISEAENSAHEILKRISELKCKSNPTKLDTIWLAHYISCLNSSFYQIHACLGNTPTGSTIPSSSSSSSSNVTTPFPQNNEEPMSKLIQASLQASKMPIVVPTPQKYVPQKVATKGQFTFESIQFEGKRPSTDFLNASPSPSPSPKSSATSPSTPESAGNYSDQQQLKRKSNDGIFSHQPHKRAYKHNAPSATNDRRCTSCNTAVTPEWRRGPLGPKSLCNACGLQFAKTLK